MFDLLDPLAIIQAVGLFGLIAIIFTESGLFFGFFLPGDSLLFTAGFLASQGLLPLAPLVIGVSAAAVLGDAVGYWFGRLTGPKIFCREDSVFFHKDHVKRARAFFEKHGPKAIVLARFFPIIRTFTPIVAGVGGMNYRTFFIYNFFGGVGWGTGMTLIGYFLGRIIPSADQYLWPIIIFVILVSFLPGFAGWRKNKKMGHESDPMSKGNADFDKSGEKK